MATSFQGLTFGTPKQVEGRPTLGVKANGIDFQQIIDAMVETKKIELIDVQDKKDKIDAKLEAFSTFQDKTQALLAAAQALQNPLPIPGLGTTFTNKIASIQSSSATPASQIVGIVADSSATAGNYSFMVNQVATSDTISSSVGETTSSGAIVGVAGGDLIINGQAIPVPATPSLQSLVSLINNYTSTTSVKASIVQVNTNDYRLNLTATDTGQPITLSDNQAGALMTSLHIASSGKTINDLSAQISYSNLTVYRPTNQVNDLIPGLNIQLLNQSPGTTLTVMVEHDLVGIQQAITNFVSIYNDYNDFVAQQKTVDMTTGEISKDSILFNDPALRNVSIFTATTMSRSVLGVAYGLGMTNLASIGITFDSTNHNNLLINNDSLNDSLINNLNSVIKIFGFNLDQTNTSINATSIPTALNSGLIDGTTGGSYDFTVLYGLDGGGVPYATFTIGVNPPVSAVMNANGTFSGPVGSLFEGFSFAYDGSVLSPGNSLSTIFTPTQGIADILSNGLSTYLDPTTGSFYLEKTQFSKDQSDLQVRLSDLETKIEKERDRLTAVYSKVADAYAKMDQQLEQIRNFNNALYGSK